MGAFVTIEGVEGAGKSTLRANLSEGLRDIGRELVFTREPGATGLGKSIRNILLDPENTDLNDTAELLLFAADRAQHVSEVIRPALSRNALVLCDRYIHSTIAYQGYGRGLPKEHLDSLNQMATEGLRPELVLLLDLDPKIGLERVHQRMRRSSGSFDIQKVKDGTDTEVFGDRFEQQELEFHQRIRQGFLELSEKESEIFVVLDASQDENVVGEQALHAIQKLLSTK